MTISQTFYLEFLSTQDMADVGYENNLLKDHRAKINERLSLAYDVLGYVIDKGHNRKLYQNIIIVIINTIQI